MSFVPRLHRTPRRLQNPSCFPGSAGPALVGLSQHRRLSVGPAVQSSVEMPTRILNCKMCSDNIKIIQNLTLITNSFPVPPILTSTAPSRHQDKGSRAGSGAPCQERLALLSGLRRPAPGQGERPGLQAGVSYQERPPAAHRVELAHRGWGRGRGVCGRGAACPPTTLKLGASHPRSPHPSFERRALLGLDSGEAVKTPVDSASS